MKLSIAIQTPEVPKTVPVALINGSLEEKIAKAAAWGADGVEFMTTEPRTLDWPAILACLQLNNIHAAAIASGAMAFAAGLTLLHPDLPVMALAKDRLYGLIDMAEALHAPVVTVGSFRGRLASMVGGGGRELLAAILQAAADYAQARGVRLALEAINRFETDFLHTAGQGLQFIAEVNRPALGLLLDTFHMNIEESSWTEPLKLASGLGRLYHVHLGDNNRLPPGKGLIDFPLIVRTLSSLGYSGYLSAELLARPDADTAARQTIDYMRGIFEPYEESRIPKPI